MNPIEQFFEYVKTNGNYLNYILTTVLILAVVIFLNKILSKLSKKLNETQKINLRNINFLFKVLKGLVWILGICFMLMQIPNFQKYIVSVLAGSSILVVILGFAAQAAMGNVISGFFISIFRPFEIGDRVRIQSENVEGFVKDITLRHTVIKTFGNSHIIIPNNVMNEAVVENITFADETTCNFLNLTVSYESDLDHAIQIIQEEAIAHKSFIYHRTTEEKESGVHPVAVKIVNLSEAGVELRVALWSNSPSDGYNLLCDLRYNIIKRFSTEGIFFPYPHRIVHMDNT